MDVDSGFESITLGHFPVLVTRVEYNIMLGRMMHVFCVAAGNRNEQKYLVPRRQYHAFFRIYFELQRVHGGLIKPNEPPTTW